MDERLTPATRLDIAVEVLVDDAWWLGQLEHWRKAGERWEGRVRWSVGVGQTHIDWVDQDRIRRVDTSDDPRPPT